MHCLVTAGATVEPIDQVRCLTNHSTGRLGTKLADTLARSGHQVTLLLSSTAQYSPKVKSVSTSNFSTTSDLEKLLKAHSTANPDAVFHVAAVSDFKVARPKQGKIASDNPHTLKLIPTPKLIQRFRKWFPEAILIGWKYEVNGGRASALVAGTAQVKRCRTDACVVNGPAYGEGYGVIDRTGQLRSANDSRALFRALKRLLT